MTRLRKMYSSRRVTSPMFSMAPALYSGTKAWSYLPKAYGSPKWCSNVVNPPCVTSRIASVSRLSASDRRQMTRELIVPLAVSSVPSTIV